MGKASFDIQYNPDAPPKVYTNSSVHTHLTVYTKVARSVHGLDYDPRTEERLDAQLMMRVGQGKKHGWFWIGDDILDTTTTPPLNHL
jgi:hypothetical protein